MKESRKKFIFAGIGILLVAGAFILVQLSKNYRTMPPGDFANTLTADEPFGTTSASTTPSPARLKWGAYVGGTVEDLTAFESLVGKPVDIEAIFWGFGDEFPRVHAAPAVKGETLLIFWDPSVGYDALLTGNYDSYIQTFARETKKYGSPIILAPFSEMNLNEEAWGYGQNGNTPEKFQRAWKYVHNFFNEVPNVSFALVYNAESLPNIPENAFSKYYPGDSFVDYIGIDGFNFGTPWQTFGEIFDSAVKSLSVYHKPIYIMSLASAAGPRKAAWINDGLGVHIKKFPQIAGWIWFNQNKEADWRVNSDEASLAAFKTIVP